jgi:UDP-2,3-diacylglucosamine pyrophosphatase LpxH
MNIINDEKVYASVNMLGDLHNEFEGLAEYIEINNIKDSAFVCVGDFTRGVGFAANLEQYEKRLIKLNEFLSNCNSIVYSIRGNHDNPKYYRGAHDFSNIVFMPDYTILSLNGKRFFCLGGAISIDRMVNIPGIDWFPDEGVVINEDELPNITDIDIMVTHTAPNGVYPFNFHTLVDEYALNDKDLKTELNLERHKLRIFFDKIKAQNPNLNKYFYGHYHQDFTTYIGTTEFTVLSIYKVLRIL